MARFLLTVWPLPTHLHPFMAVAHGLRKLGHEVAFYTGASAAGTIGGEGFRLIPFQALDEQAVNGAVDALIRKKLSPRQWHEFLLGSIPQQLQDLDTILAGWAPHALLCDMAMWGPILVLHETRRIPVAVLSHVATCILPGPEHPFPGMRWLLQGIRPRVARLAIARVLRFATRGVRREASEIRKSHGLAPLTQTVTEYTGTLPLYLVPGTSEFDGGRRDLPPSAHYTGPCLWEEQADRSPVESLRQALPGRRLVLVTEGSLYSGDATLLRTAASGLANKPMNVLMLAGYKRNPASLNPGALAANIRIGEWAPLGEILPFCDAIVACGDSETTMAALAAGVPMVAVPEILDQPEVAMCLANSGAGIRIPARRCSPARLAAAVDLVLNDPTYRANATRISARMAEYNGGERAAELLGALVEP